MPPPALVALRAGAAVASTVPAPVARRVAETAAVGISHLSARSRRHGHWARRRRLLASHLARVTGASGPPLQRMVDEAIASYARYWAESLRIPSLSDEQIEAGMRYDHYERITTALDPGRGVILALPHLGGWEWAGTHLARSGHHVTVVVEKLSNPEIFDWFTSFRTGIGMNVVAAGPDAAARCAAALASNHILCLLSDRLIAGATGVPVSFFGETTLLPAGPAALALRSGAPLLPAAVYFEAGDGHLGRVAAPLDTSRRGRIREDVTRVTQDLARAFEDLIKRNATQWHMLQPNWPSDSGL